MTVIGEIEVLKGKGISNDAANSKAFQDIIKLIEDHYGVWIVTKTIEERHEGKPGRYEVQIEERPTVVSDCKFTTVEEYLASIPERILPLVPLKEHGFYTEEETYQYRLPEGCHWVEASCLGRGLTYVIEKNPDMPEGFNPWEENNNGTIIS